MAWPLSLPQNPSSVTSSPQSVALSTPMSTGYAKVRRRFTKTYSRYDVSYEMTLDQFYTFENYFDFTLGYGVVEFDLPDPMKINEYITCIFIQNEGESPYGVSPIGGSEDLQVTFSVEELG